MNTLPNDIARCNGHYAEGWMRRLLVRLFRRDDGWVKSDLIAQDGQTIYGVRDKPGHEREVQDRWNRWTPESKAKFSVLPCFEEYHRRRFFTAVPFPPRVNGKMICELAADYQQNHPPTHAVHNPPNSFIEPPAAFDPNEQHNQPKP
jgi:hypothetical protein